jgi:hypothetical protein
MTEEEADKASIRISERVADHLSSVLDLDVPDQLWEDITVKICDIAKEEIRDLRILPS